MSIGGGGGGGFLGSIGSIVGGMFGGPIGAMIGKMIGELVQSVAGQVLQQAGQQLGNVSQQGLQAGQNAFEDAFNGRQGASGGGGAAGLDPANLVNSFIADLGGATPQQGADVQNAVQDLQKAISKFFTQMIHDNDGSRKHRGHGAAAGGGGTASAAGGGDAASGVDGGGSPAGVDSSDDGSGDDFFIAMAKGLGSAMQNQANKVQELSEKISKLSDKSAAAGPDSDEAKAADKELAKDQTLLAGESSKMQFLGQAVQTALSSVGQALGTLARKD